MQEIAKKIVEHEGAGLFIDYGYDYDFNKSIHTQQTLRAIKGHAFQNLFKDVGSADLSCSVDFAALRYALKFVGKSTS